MYSYYLKKLIRFDLQTFQHVYFGIMLLWQFLCIVYDILKLRNVL